MDKDTVKTKEWLDKRFTMGVKEGKYFAHEPIYGYMKGPTEGRDLIRYARIISNLEKISRFEFDNFMDVGGAEGYTAYLVKKIFNADSYTCDLSYEANLRARELFGLDSVGIDLSNLPFKDDAFDIVLCSETLEHVTNAVQAVCELRRVAKKALIITTEAACYDRLERRLRMLLTDLKGEHADRNWFIVEDFTLLLGKDFFYENTIPDEVLFGRKGYSLEEARAILKRENDGNGFVRTGIGLSVLFTKSDPVRRPRADREELTDAVLSATVNMDYGKNVKDVAPCPSNKLLGTIRCPVCLQAVKEDSGGLICAPCNKKYAVRHGVPLMYTDEADRVHLARKWDDIYENRFNATRMDVIRLIKLFKDAGRGANFLFRFLAKRLLKLKRFAGHVKTALRERSAGEAILYFLHRGKEKILKEIKRMIGRRN